MDLLGIVLLVAFIIWVIYDIKKGKKIMEDIQAVIKKVWNTLRNGNVPVWVLVLVLVIWYFS